MSTRRKTILLAALGVTTVGIVGALAATIASSDDGAGAEPVAAAEATPEEPRPAPNPAAAPAPFVRPNRPATAAPSPSPPARAEASPSPSQPPIQDDEGPRLGRAERRREMLERFDRDGNGELDDGERTELRQERLSRQFQELDKNGDGQLSLEEFQAQRARFGRRANGRPTAPEQP